MNQVEVVRGELVESRHQVHVAVCDADGRLIASVGDVEGSTFYRSAAKPMQALPLVEEGVVDRFGLSVAELSLCCASHEGEPEHVDGAREILAKAGADESLLRCGPQAPFSERETRRLIETRESPGRIHNNCSGKHAGMIALAVHMGWDPAEYHRPDHPVQRRMLREIVRFSGVAPDSIPTGVDGCGVVCFGVPLRAMARSFGAFTAAADAGESAGRVVDAMTKEPFMVGGTNRTCTDLMAAAGDRVFVKLGAEGVYGAGLRGQGVGIAIKVDDGGRRAVEVALVHTLSQLGALTPGEVEALRAHGRPAILNTLGDVVGEVRPAFDLIHAGDV